MIATAIREELQRATAAAAQGQLPADPAANAVPAGPLRTLKIQLRPEDLGVVTVEMRLSNGQLETHLRASQPETAALLHKDTALLTDLLSNSGYRAEVSVGQAARSADAGGSGGSQQQASQQQAASSFADGGARPGNEGARQRQDAQRQAATTRREGERTDEAVRPRDGGVYL
ncbi:flagellar hook-length control protein FliK [Methylobacterium sp. J-072]|uniref:flagellar hook-length control protein FliK n=1 Tax=Methylobacterium sp. J-072 TaxID=2836651 RepID=UPI001FB967FA|nr:flagellar hook-length control protein FliK [Methylobacterium sp. J-072]MCJ2090925.1 flagellar hook-length control protein FliK [Methylobacterium sp. J-072]